MFTTLYAHFDVKPRKVKARKQTAKQCLMRLPGECPRAFKWHQYREHQTLYQLGPGILLEELAVGVRSFEPITMSNIHAAIFSDASPAA